MIDLPGTGLRNSKKVPKFWNCPLPKPNEPILYNYVENGVEHFNMDVAIEVRRFDNTYNN